MMMKRTLLGLVTLTVIGCGGGAGSSGGSNTGGGVPAEYEGPIQSDDIATGESRYQAACAVCHDGGAPPLENIGWTAARTRQQIREGSGSMPPMPDNRLSGEDMEAILAYMVTIGAVSE
ncbi:MAG: cytochrome c [Myxococcota bacterium]